MNFPNQFHAHELVTVQKIFPDDNPADLPPLIVALCGEIISIRMRVLQVGVG